MGKRNKKTTHTNNVASPTLTAAPIKDVLNKGNQGVILVSQKALQAIFKNSGDLAKSNEFQTHYWAINYRYKADDGSILDICIPTAYFNYAQEVSSAAIDFDLKDVKEISEKLEPIHNMKANEIIALGIQEKLEAALGVSLESSPSNFNSIHRHPGSSKSQGFSATDLTKTASEPGVVYPLESATETPNFAGIMAIDSGVNNVARYEYRVASGTLGTDLTYSKGRCAAFIIDAPRIPSTVESLFGVPAKDMSYKFYDDSADSDILTAIYSIAYELYNESHYLPFTDSVTSAHLKKAPTTNYYYNSYNYTKATKREPYYHRFISSAELAKLTTIKLNDLRKELIYLKTEKVNNTWVPKEDKNIEVIESIQEELGFTADTIYGPKGIQNPFKTNAEYSKLYVFPLRTAYETLCWYLQQPNTTDKDYSLTKEDFIDKIEDLRKLYNGTLVPKYGVKPTSSSDDLVIRDDLTAAQKTEVADAQEILERYQDIEFLDTTDDSLSFLQLNTHLSYLEELYYQDIDGFAATQAYSDENARVEIDLTRMLIESELEEANEVIQKYSILKEEPTPPSIDAMRKELILVSKNPVLVNQLTNTKIIEMYNEL